MFSTNRSFLLPVVITVSFLVALLGIRVQSYVKPVKNKLTPRAVLEVQAKETKEGLDKSGQLFAPRSNTSSFAPTAFYIETFHHEIRYSSSVTVTSPPARASPTLHS